MPKGSRCQMGSQVSDIIDIAIKLISMAIDLVGPETGRKLLQDADVALVKAIADKAEALKFPDEG